MKPLTAEDKERRAQKDEQIRDRFHYKVPTETHREWFADATEVIDELVDFILRIPDSQPRAVALTQLGLTRMLINAAIIDTPPDDFEIYNEE